MKKEIDDLVGSEDQDRDRDILVSSRKMSNKGREKCNIQRCTDKRLSPKKRRRGI